MNLDDALAILKKSPYIHEIYQNNVFEPGDNIIKVIVDESAENCYSFFDNLISSFDFFECRCCSTDCDEDDDGNPIPFYLWLENVQETRENIVKAINNHIADPHKRWTSGFY